MTSRGVARYGLRRLSQAVVVMLVVVFGNFLLLQLAPGDLVDILAGTSDLSAEQMTELRVRYGLDQPVLVQAARYAVNLAQFDLGVSPRNSAPVIDIIAERIPVTATLVVLSVAVSLSLGTIIGVIAARFAGRPLDTVLSIGTLLFYATPSFIIAIVMILVFSVFLQWLPISGLASVGHNLTGFARIKDVAEHLVLPVAALSTFYTAIYARLGRAAMLEILTQDYIRTARATGIPERRVLWRHALRNALLPLVTMAGLQVSSLIGGAVLVETVFGLPGLGRTAFDAVMERDTNLLLGVLFVSSLGVVCVNLVVDMLYLVIDPRVELT
jgi:peptide/nickel transport system permease protein